jgi:hypothetical protein
MALVKYGGGVIQMSGSIAGNTFARNRYGNYARAKTKPINPRTTLQSKVRSCLADLTDLWSQDLLTAQRTSWNLYASSVAMKNKLGEVVYLSGFNHFIRSNMLLNIAGLPMIGDGPTVFELPEADPLFAVNISHGTQLISITFDATGDWDNETGGRLYVGMGSPQNPQRNFFNGPWRLAGVLSGVTGAPIASPQTMPTVFHASVGQRVWCYARIQRADGRLSEPFRDDCFVGA